MKKELSIPSDKQCPLCKSGALIPAVSLCRDYISKDIFNLHTCPSCKCCITSANVKSERKEYYGENYYNVKAGKFTSFFERIFRLNHKRNARNLHRNFPSKHTLEVGCGRAYILKELRELGSEVTCLESSSAADWILNNQEVRVATLDNEDQWPFDTEKFDLIIYWHVFEHLPDPIKSLEQATRCLTQDGTLCISVPNISSLQAQVHPSTWFHLDVPRHLFHFSTKGLTGLLVDHGYQIMQVSPGDRIQNLFGWLQSMANIFTPWAINSFYRLLQGGHPLRSINKLSLAVQLITIPIWVPIGLAGYLLEELIGNHGTVTVYAKKHQHNTIGNNTTRA